MKIKFLTIGNKNYPSSRYRGYDFVKELNKRGLKSKISPIGDKKYFLNLCFEFLTLFNFKKRIIYLQKVDHPIIRFLLRLHRLKGNKVIFDFDDAIFILEPQKTKSIIKISDVVIVGNNYLSNYTKKYNKNVFVIPTSIDLEKIGSLRKDYSKNNKKIVIGWIGSKWTLKYLEEIKKSLEKLSKKYPFELRIIGPKNCEDELPKFKNITIKIIPWKFETEWKELLKVDIGIMPLPDNDWAKGKCALKLLQYMALGIPAIGSNVGANKEAIKNGKTGFLVSNEKEWEVALEKLIKDKKLRMKLGKAGRKTVEKNYSLEKNVSKLSKIIKKTDK